MALDSYDRTAALNAVIEAWTRKGSNPFIQKFTVNAGASKSFTCTSGWVGLLLTYANGTDTFGLFEAYALPSLVFGRSLSSTTTISVSGTPSSFSVTNSGPRTANCIMISLEGIMEEV